jgi:hypothetical protein
MYSYAARIAPRDRWAIVAYLRALQLSQDATLDDVPAEARATGGLSWPPRGRDMLHFRRLAPAAVGLARSPEAKHLPAPTRTRSAQHGAEGFGGLGMRVPQRKQRPVAPIHRVLLRQRHFANGV